MKTHTFVKRSCFWSIIRCQFNLSDIMVSIQDCLQQRCPNPLPLICWKNQNILNKHYCVSIANNSDYSLQFIATISGKYQQRIFKSHFQFFRIGCVGSPPNG